MLAWVVGAGGLLGSSVRRAFDARPGSVTTFVDEERLPWADGDRLAAAFRARAERFVAQAVEGGSKGWAVVWCAGAAVVASEGREIDADREAFVRFLEGLESALDATPGAGETGHVLLASSAGGVWAGHVGSPISETTPVRPLSPYGVGHLAREAALTSFAARRKEVRTAAIRISNLYGPGQHLDKPQGLVSQIARSSIQRRPVSIYVPLDTVRDYLFAADAGRGMADILERLARSPEAAPSPLIKILASEEETSVGGLLAVFRRVTRRRVPVVAGLSPLGRLQPLSLRFRSEVWTSAGRDRKTPLPEGVASVHRHLLGLFTRGLLPPPAPGTP
jgi:UDP-glucose 4-epimerase